MRRSANDWRLRQERAERSLPPTPDKAKGKGKSRGSEAGENDDRGKTKNKGHSRDRPQLTSAKGFPNFPRIGSVPNHRVTFRRQLPAARVPDYPRTLTASGIRVGDSFFRADRENRPPIKLALRRSCPTSGLFYPNPSPLPAMPATARVSYSMGMLGEGPGFAETRVLALGMETSYTVSLRDSDSLRMQRARHVRHIHNYGGA